ncbi:MAG: hypothetical protein ACREIV_09005, partial [Planctomycetaceae bacterium]
MNRKAAVERAMDCVVSYHRLRELGTATPRALLTTLAAVADAAAASKGDPLSRKILQNVAATLSDDDRRSPGPASTGNGRANGRTNGHVNGHAQGHA